MDKQLVSVVWNDAWADTDNFATAHAIAQTHQPMVVHSLGWLLHEDEAGMSIANECSSEDGKEIFRGRTFIPKAMIQSVTPYKLTKPRHRVSPAHSKKSASAGDAGTSTAPAASDPEVPSPCTPSLASSS